MNSSCQRAGGAWLGTGLGAGSAFPSSAPYGVYQMGEVYARSWVTMGVFGSGLVPKYLA